MLTETEIRQGLRRAAKTGKRVILADGKVPGLRLRATPNGSASWSLWYRNAAGTPKFFTLDSYPLLGLADARDAAKDLLAKVRLGVDPQVEKLADRTRSKNGETFKALVDRYAKRHGPNMRPRSLAEFRRSMELDVLPTLGAQRVDAVTRASVRSVVQKIVDRGARVQANRTLAYLRATFRWAIGEDIIEPSADPTLGLKRPTDERERERVYTDAEVRAIFSAVTTTELADVVPLLFYCATRSEETRSGRWADVDLERKLWTIPSEATKTAKAHPVPLSPGAVRVLDRIRERNPDGKFLFPAPTAAGYANQPNKAIARLKALAKTAAEIAKKEKRSDEDEAFLARYQGLPADFRLHDIRRTAATRLGESGVSEEIVERILGHARRKLTRTYQTAVPLLAMRAALATWSDKLDAIVSGEKRTADVVSIAR